MRSMLTTVSPSHQCLSVCLSVFCMLLTLQSATSYKRLNSVLIVISVAVSCVRGGASPRNRRGYRVRCGEGIYPSTMAVKPVCLEVGFVVRFLKIIVITVNEGVISAPGRGGGEMSKGCHKQGAYHPPLPPKHSSTRVMCARVLFSVLLLVSTTEAWDLGSCMEQQEDSDSDSE